MHLNADLHPNFFIYNFIKFYTNCSKHIFQAQTQSNMNHFHLLLTRMFCLIGSLMLTISSLSAQRSAETIKILAVGNSFSDDGVEYLDELAKAAGIKLIIGNLYIGGCSLERHWNNVQDELPAYDYRKNVEGVQTNTPKTTLQQALQDEEWDYITVQQVSQNSGLYDTYYPYIAARLAKLIQVEPQERRGILICGTGIGMCISANKFKGIRAAVVHDCFAGARSRLSNDCNVLCLGSRVIGLESAKMLVGEWLELGHVVESSRPKVEAICAIEGENFR